MKTLDALEDILADESRLSATDDGIEEAVAALDKIVNALSDGRRPVWRVDGKLNLERALSTRGRSLFCNVCHLESITMYDPDIEAAYLIVDGKLLLIEEIRPSRECSHWRVKLALSRTQLPVQGTARVFVSPNFNLSGKMLEEINTRG